MEKTSAKSVQNSGIGTSLGFPAKAISVEIVTLLTCSSHNSCEGGRSQRVLSTPWGNRRESRTIMNFTMSVKVPEENEAVVVH